MSEIFMNNIKQLSFIHSKEVRSSEITHHIKNAGITYTHRIINGQCWIKYNNSLLAEGEILEHRKKLYKVEDCLLERAYHVCGPNILVVLKFVCRLAKKYTEATYKTGTSSPLTTFYRHTRSAKILTESCCRNICTIPELTRYCPRKS
ncbi:unnamed protein product [Didymodactylos carnosus]|uniref:Insulin-like domain-containing protein n=1 Tax=Didymodactylos carnosus TaxID=1234261 RepID=A0A8S2EUX6_9BILA|nr:unnamed protein product [Didymodactylos carnosus]CAF4115585.1 unnamed protein product [Didymodactylos carnosus]